MNPYTFLDDKLLLETFHRAVELELEHEFIIQLEDEILNRNLMTVSIFLIEVGNTANSAENRT
ncbi:sporulation histidine kinase inhibitor Sda [Bacillus dakarensis]|uniref:sporulation histidine kinase inhibitor Sda n=1 Tax=Robertmurraya dakarensis TaxID=1926278 RepID=UPI0009812C00|nr:sporulation histidine kinase inhibitor Sda [Bacillus dakarensis]